MSKILFLAHRVPFPPDKGDKIRAFHILKHLAARHDVWLGAGVDDPADLHRIELSGVPCREVCLAPLGRARRGLNMLGGLGAGAPLSVARFRHPRLARWIGQVLSEVRPDVVFVYSSAMAQYVVGRTAPGARLIIDFVDADAEKWRAYAAKAGPPLSAVYAREFRRLVAFEGRALAAADAGILISETERRLMAALLPAGAHKLSVIPNGVDVDYFAASAGRGDGRSIVLCGRMDYQPNIDAAQWFAREILPRVRTRRPDALFRIVGAAPAPGVRALAALAGVEVTGAVPDVRPYLAQAAVVVAPLRIARGVQNKVLEGMAAARPVVATPEALDGIDAAVGRDVLVGAGAAAFAEAVGDVLTGRAPERLGASARRFVLGHHQWAAQLSALDRLLAEGGRTASAEAAA
ncbi:MAG: Sugar transferase, PEP-CTERM/EpsH1 system associated [Phenylobacterium sp.]|nr:Sugar transferase, PEP-CTERM/EpsH1 system associated [Phenylobacterium sp.]